LKAENDFNENNERAGKKGACQRENTIDAFED